MRALLIVLLLAGCASLPEKVDEVKVGVHTPCVKKNPVPPVLKFKNAEGDIYAQVDALLYDRTVLKNYVLDLEEVVAGCK